VTDQVLGQRGIRLSHGDVRRALEKQSPSVVALVETELVNRAPRYAFVLAARFGINRNKMTLREIGEILEVTPERVRQIEVGGIRMIWAYYAKGKEFNVVPWEGVKCQK
jgi:DNA-directed RNA polymerase sigma subunit (sigma70/sigma32)